MILIGATTFRLMTLSIMVGRVLLYWVSIMPSVVYVECHKLSLYAECPFAECHNAECRSTILTVCNKLTRTNC